MTANYRRSAVVTGSNVGIGFEIVKKLCRQFDGDVYLTSLKESDGHSALEEIQDSHDGLVRPKLHQLDVTDINSVNALKKTILLQNGGLDILVNNAGIMFQPNSQVPFREQARKTLQTNFWGVVNVCEAFFPILRPHARIVNISSLLGKKAFEECSPILQTSFQDENLTKEKLFQLIEQFLSAAQKCDDSQELQDWSKHSYGISKLGLKLLTEIHQKYFDSKDPEKDIIVNSCTPGWVRTQMGGPDATKSPEEGADTPTFLALLPPSLDTNGPPKGKFWKDRTVDDWW